MSNLLNALESSLIVNRKDKTGQSFWTEWRTDLVAVGGTSTQAGAIPLLNASGQIDPSMVSGGGGSSVLIEVNGTPVAVQDVANFIAGTNIIITSDNAGGLTFSASGSFSTSFNLIASGNNNSADLIVSGSASLTYSGNGIVNANEIGGIDIAGNSPAHEGQLLISQPGNTTAVWADPLVQGLYPGGSSISSPPAYATPTTIQPVYIGGSNPSADLTGISVDDFGNVNVNVISSPTSPRTPITFFIDTISGITSESLALMTINHGGSPSTSNSYTVTSGKTLRLQNITTSIQGTNSTVQTSKIRVRSAPSSVSTSSPIIYGSFLSTSGITNHIGVTVVDFSDGLEISSGQQIGISHLESSVNSNLTVCLVGFEY